MSAKESMDDMNSRFDLDGLVKKPDNREPEILSDSSKSSAPSEASKKQEAPETEAPVEAPLKEPPPSAQAVPPKSSLTAMLAGIELDDDFMFEDDDQEGPEEGERKEDQETEKTQETNIEIQTEVEETKKETPKNENTASNNNFLPEDIDWLNDEEEETPEADSPVKDKPRESPSKPVPKIDINLGLKAFLSEINKQEEPEVQSPEKEAESPAITSEASPSKSSPTKKGKGFNLTIDTDLVEEYTGPSQEEIDRLENLAKEVGGWIDTLQEEIDKGLYVEESQKISQILGKYSPTVPIARRGAPSPVAHQMMATPRKALLAMGGSPPKAGRLCSTPMSGSSTFRDKNGLLTNKQFCSPSARRNSSRGPPGAMSQALARAVSTQVKYTKELPFETLLEEFDKMEKLAVGQIKTPKPKVFTSQMEDFSWKKENSQDIPGVDFDKQSFMKLLMGKNIKDRFTCYTLSQDNSSMIVLGVETGEMVELNLLKNKAHKDKLGSKISSVGLSLSNEYVAAGLQSGEVVVKKTGDSWAAKVKKKVSLDSGPIIFLKFIDNSSFIAGTEKCLYRLTIKDLKVYLDCSKYPLLHQVPEPILHISFVETESFPFLFIAFPSSLKLYRIQEHFLEAFSLNPPTAGPSLSNPNYLPPSLARLASLTPSRPACLIICQGTSFCLLREPTPETPVFSFLGSFTLKKPVLKVFVLRNRNIILIHSDYEVRVTTMKDLIETSEALNTRESEPSLTDQTSLKDPQFIGSDFKASFKFIEYEHSMPATITLENPKGVCYKSWGENIQQYSNYLYLAKPNAFTILYLNSYEEMMLGFADKQDWKAALRLGLDLWEGKLISSPEELEGSRQMAKKVLTRFVDKEVTNKPLNDESRPKQVQILKICMEVLLVSNQMEHLFDNLRPKFDPEIFWKETESLVERGLIKGAPLRTLKAGGLFLSPDAINRSVYYTDMQETMSYEEGFGQAINLLKKKKLWHSLLRLAMLRPDFCFDDILTFLISDLVVSEEKVSPLLNACDQDKDSLTTSLHSSITLQSYIRIFWFLRSIISWSINKIGYLELSDQALASARTGSRFKLKEELLVKTIRWMLDPSNLLVLCKVNPQLSLEIFFELFIHVDFKQSDSLGLELKNRVDSIRADIQNGGAKKPVIEEDVEGGASDQTKDSQETAPEVEMPPRRRDDSLIVFKSIIENLLQFSGPKYQVDISFLSLKLISLSIFERIYDDPEFVSKIVMSVLSEPFEENRFWLSYMPVSKEDFEEKTVRVIVVFKTTQYFKDNLEEMRVKALENKFYRVQALILEVTKGPVEALKQYIASSESANLFHFFSWIKKTLADLSYSELQLPFCFEISNSLPVLLEKNIQKTHELITKIPWMGDKFLETLK